MTTNAVIKNSHIGDRRLRCRRSHAIACVCATGVQMRGKCTTNVWPTKIIIVYYRLIGRRSNATRDRPTAIDLSIDTDREIKRQTQHQSSIDRFNGRQPSQWEPLWSQIRTFSVLIRIFSPFDSCKPNSLQFCSFVRCYLYAMILIIAANEFMVRSERTKTFYIRRLIITSFAVTLVSAPVFPTTRPLKRLLSPLRINSIKSAAKIQNSIQTENWIAISFAFDLNDNYLIQSQKSVCFSTNDSMIEICDENKH